MAPQQPLTRPPAESHSSIALVLMVLFTLNSNGATVDDVSACLSTLTNVETRAETGGFVDTP